MAGGDFPYSPGEGTHHIALWSGASWKNFGACVNSSINALTIYQDDLMVGGTHLQWQEAKMRTELLPGKNQFCKIYKKVSLSRPYTGGALIIKYKHFFSFN